MKCYLCKTELNEDGSPVQYYKCKKCQRLKAKEAYAKNPDKFRKRRREFKENNSTKQKSYDRKARQKLKIDALNAYSNNMPKCICCNETEIDFLCLDHIDNDGSKHRRLTGGGNSFYFWLRKNGYPKLRLQVMCYNCNNSKKINGYCIHQKGK